jgi:dihydrofolate reductase
MRKVISSLFISLDGVAEEPSDWQFEFDDEMGAEMGSEIAATDTILLGRVTYEYWNQYWPTAEDEFFANHINSTPKVVVSTTLDNVNWGKFDTVTLVKGNLKEEITRLKKQTGKNIAVAGSPTLARSMLQADLLDELKLWVHPVVAGIGKKLFDAAGDLKKLKLVATKPTPSGVVILTYQPAGKEG